ncbi:MAG: hypothetical protein QOF77_1799 [Solirubrobacteraceae bacterium]|nr:hypothetical protein [Solirubrobacteraceae bacterium]
MASPIAVLMDRLGLSDEEALSVFEVDPLSAISGDLAHRPELGILLSLSDAAAERVGEPLLRRWLRADGPAGRPIALLLAGDFAGFEDALATLVERGLVLRGGGSRPA